MIRELRPAFVSAGELFGGVERHLLGMCTWLRRKGRTPLLLLFHNRELAHQARALGVNPIILKSAGRFDPTGPRRLAAILAEHHVNVVHAHGYRAVVNTALAHRQYEFAVVRTVHGLVEESAKLSARAIKSRFYTWLERTAAKAVGTTTCYVTKDLQRAHLQSDDGLVTSAVYNGIDLMDPSAYERPPDLDPTAFNFAAVGRVSRIKGLADALRAMTRIDPALGVVLNIIGTGPLEAELKRDAAALGLGSSVRFLGFKENVYDYLAHIDCLIMPSLHEGLPYTILEAMSLGKPILATRTGGLAEILDHGRNALLVEVGDVAGLAAAMENLVENSELARALGVAGRKKQESELTLEQMGAAYWRLYEDAG